MKTRMKRSSYPVFCALAALALASCTLTPGNQVPAPVMNPAPGVFMDQVKVTIKCSDPDAVIFYTTNGAAPSASSMQYRNDVLVRGRDVTLTAIACVPGKDDSTAVTGTYQLSWLEFPNSGNPNPFTNPTGIALTNGRIYVTDRGSNTLFEVPDISGNTWTTFGGPISINIPMGVSGGGGDGRLYVTDASSAAKIVRTTRMDGADAESYGSFGTLPGQFREPSGITVAKGYMYVADTSNHRIQRIPVFDGLPIVDVLGGTRGNGIGQFDTPSGIAVDPVDDLIYVADTLNNRIVMVNGIPTIVDWKPVSTNKDSTDSFSSPFGVALDSQRRIYVADTNNNRIVRFEQLDGTGWTTFGTSGGGYNQFVSPHGIAIDDTGRVYVADSGNRRIVCFIWPSK